MKVTFKNIATGIFSDLEIGDVFEYDTGGVYIKSEETECTNCVRLSDGSVGYCSSLDKVTLLDAEIIVKYK